MAALVLGVGLGQMAAGTGADALRRAGLRDSALLRGLFSVRVVLPYYEPLRDEMLLPGQL
jgi:hypothetical protein